MLDRYRQGLEKILITTNVLSRGIDIEQVRAVGQNNRITMAGIRSQIIFFYLKVFLWSRIEFCWLVNITGIKQKSWPSPKGNNVQAKMVNVGVAEVRDGMWGGGGSGILC